MLKHGYEIPDSLVFLGPADYERLDNESGKFALDKEDKGDHRNPFERDRARILHSPFFRNLGGKSQVFDPNQSDFFRTRLTHSLEVAQIAKVMAIEICEGYRETKASPSLSPWEQIHFCDLVEAVGLAHDIGHPPFGHIGEAVLNEMMSQYSDNGFEANAQNLRILTKLDRAYPGRPGFTRGVLAGVMKYKARRSAGFSKFIYDDDWDVVEIACPWWKHDDVLRQVRSRDEFEIEVKKSRTLACQVMDLADEVTYAGHDIEDVLHTPLLRYGTIKVIDALEKHTSKKALEKIRFEVEFESGCSLDSVTLQEGWKELQSRILEVFRAGSPAEFKTMSHRLRRAHMNDASASCHAVKDDEGNWRVRISQESALRSALIRLVVVPLVHHDSKLVTLQRKGIKILRAIFEELIGHGHELLPWDYQEMFLNTEEPHERARICCDFIAAMAEDYALRFYRRLFESERGLLTDFF